MSLCRVVGRSSELAGLVSPWSAPWLLTQSEHKVNAATRALKGVAGTMPGESEEVVEFELRRRSQVERWPGVC